MNTAEVKRVIEGALLCANKPLSVSDLRQLFAGVTDHQLAVGSGG